MTSNINSGCSTDIGSDIDSSINGISTIHVFVFATEIECRDSMRGYVMPFPCRPGPRPSPCPSLYPSPRRACGQESYHVA